MKPLFFALCVAFAFADVRAQTHDWQPTLGHTQLPIWPGAAPDPQPVAGPEFAKSSGKDDLVAGGQVVEVDNVTRPTMTVYSPKGKNTGAAVVVFPGGGYQILAIDLEGTEVCDWLTPKGITCVLLKYRVTDVGPYPKSGPYPESPMALEDAQRTVGLVRFHAVEWHIDPHKIGVLGFSAGGHLVAAMSTHFDKRLYPAVDAADKESCRPDFAVAIYPGHLSIAAAAEYTQFCHLAYCFAAAQCIEGLPVDIIHAEGVKACSEQHLEGGRMRVQWVAAFDYITWQFCSRTGGSIHFSQQRRNGMLSKALKSL